MRVIVTGARKLKDKKLVFKELDLLYRLWFYGKEPGERFIVVHGNNPNGADAFADEWARSGKLYVEVEPVDAHWELLGGHAGAERNGRMVARGADVCLAFPRGKSTGTRDCMQQAHDAGIVVRKR